MSGRGRNRLAGRSPSSPVSGCIATEGSGVMKRRSKSSWLLRYAAVGQHGPDPAGGASLEALERVAGLAAARSTAQEVAEPGEQEDAAPGLRLALGGRGEHGVAAAAGTEDLAGAPHLAPVESRVAEAHADAIAARRGCG